MDRVYSPAIRDRLIFETHLVRSSFFGFPTSVLFIILWFTIMTEYPVASFSKIHATIAESCFVPCQRLPANISAAFAIVVNCVACLQEYSISHNTSSVYALSRSSIVSPVFAYTASRMEVDCSDDSSLILAMYRDVVRNGSSNSTCSIAPVVCFHDGRFENVNSTGWIDDSEYGLIPVTIINSEGRYNTPHSVIESVSSVWFTPNEKILTLSEIRTHFDGFDAIPSVSHTSVRRTDDDVQFWRLLILALSISCLMVLIDTANMVNKNRSRWTLRQSRFLHRVCPLIASCGIAGVLAFKCYRLSLSNWNAIIGILKQQQTDPQTLLNSVGNIKRLMRLFALERTATTLILWLSVFRFVIYISVHPRMAILTDTLRKGWDRLVHFLLVYITLLLCFALMYVTVIDDRITYYRTIFKLSGFIMGNPAFPNNSFVSVVFGIMFGFIMCITGLYFLLALAVSAYQEYLEDIAKSKHIVRPFLTDLRLILTVSVLSVWNRWPSRTQALRQFESNGTPGDPKLQHMLNWYSCHFPNTDAVQNETETARIENVLRKAIQKRNRTAWNAAMKHETDMIKRALNSIQTKYTL